MPRVLGAPRYRLLLTADTVGGVWRYALDLARGLLQVDVAVTLASLGPPASEDQLREAEAVCGLNLIETGQPLDWLCERPEEVTRAAQAIAEIASARRIDLIQLNGTALGGGARFAMPVVAINHSCLATWWQAVKDGPTPVDWDWRVDLTRRHLHAVDSVAAPTRALAAATKAAYGLAIPPRTIHNGRPWPNQPSALHPARAVLTAGRLWDEGKNVVVLDRAARGVQAPVYAAGSARGPNGAQIELSAIQQLGVLSEDHMRARLAERPIFASTALYEPFGLAALEAAQSGCALLLSDIPTFRELWDDAALFVCPRDPNAVAVAANRLLDEPALRASLSDAARNRARSYDMQGATEATLNWHLEVLNRSGRSGSWESAA